MELWDIYDDCFQKTGRTHVRGEELAKGDNHLVVHIYPINSKGQLLIQKRAKNVKVKPGMWAATGGSVIAGEELWDGAKRELKEEVGLTATRENTELFSIIKRRDRFTSIWFIHTDAPIEEIKLQEEEVEDAKWASIEEIYQMMEEGLFWHYDYFDWMVQMLKSKGYIS